MSNHVSSGSGSDSGSHTISGSLPGNRGASIGLKEMQLQLKELQQKSIPELGCTLNVASTSAAPPQRRFNSAAPLVVNWLYLQRRFNFCTLNVASTGCTSQRRFNFRLHLSTSLQLRLHLSTSLQLPAAPPSNKRRSDNELY
jgi:hypothetical protein